MADTEQAADPTAKAEAEAAARAARGLPGDAIPIVPVRDLVLFPGVVLPIAVGRRMSVAAAQAAVRERRPLGVLMQRDPAVEEPNGAAMTAIGVVATVMRYLTAPDGTHHTVCQGDVRFRVVEWLEGYPFLAARVERLPEAVGPFDPEIEARFNLLRDQSVEALRLLPETPQELVQMVQSIDAPPLLADMVAHYLDIDPGEKQAILETADLRERLDRVSALLRRRTDVLRLTRELSQQTQGAIDKRQREFLLREQLRTIQKELGEADDQAEEVEALDRAIAEAAMPEPVERHVRKELQRLERLPEAAAEYGMLRTYLEWMTELPWSRTTARSIDIAEARRILDEDHFGLEKIKRRILEHLAVRKLNPEGKAPILCFAGPPGVGKTSLGQSIARATGREFARIALGGVSDEAEIRGHRRTYVGAMPGNIVQTLRKAGTRDPVIMLDEIDKLSTGFRGDPAAAMLEVLDPEQNTAFNDNYIGVSFDLSRVMFICTANVLYDIPGPLRDRMEVIGLAGYTEEEKLEIARRYLLRRQRVASGLDERQLVIEEAAVRRIVGEYTREAGVRGLEREIGAVARHAAMRIAEGAAETVHVGAEDVPAILGAPRFESEVAQRTSLPGVVTGLAWTPSGGDVLFIEATRYPGNGKLILTGQLGDVMRESVQAALSLMKSRAAALGLEREDFDRNDIHVHVPAGAIPKDGPSAGVAMYCALVSLLTGRCVRSDTAMTGEISLRGLVLPVGGIKEKVVAAARAGLKRVMLPARNRHDLDDVPESARRQIEIVWLETVDQATAVALDCQPEDTPAPDVTGTAAE